MFRAFKQFISKIIFKTEGHNWHTEFVYHTGQVIDVMTSEKLSLVDEDTIRKRVHFLNITKYIHLVVNGHRISSHANSARNDSESITGIQCRSHNDNGFSLLLVVVGYLENFNGLTRVHGTVFIV